MRGRTPNQPGWPALLIRWLTVVIASFFFFCLCRLRKGLNNIIISLIKAKHLGKTRQDKTRRLHHSSQPG